MAYNQSDALFEQSTDTNGNFGNSVSGQTNSFFLPKVYSKKVLKIFRNAEKKLIIIKNGDHSLSSTKWLKILIKELNAIV